MKNGESSNSRRNFLKGVAASLLLVPMWQACREQLVTLLIKLSGTNHLLGHRLRKPNFPKPSKSIAIPYLIVGGGIAGLSAARGLSQQGVEDFLLLELESHTGGNASNGENAYSKYPLGAHYLPLPNKEDQELIRFLEESQIITGRDANGFAVFDETQLCFSPQERLYYRNSWQEGLVPKLGNTAQEDAQFERFFAQMETFRKLRAANGQYAFDIPIANVGFTPETAALDQQTMKAWLNENGFDAAPLLWYVDYCCRDDFGMGIETVSAWAGVHYFAARKHDVTAPGKDSVLTWPEGNARLASHLKKYSDGKTLKKHLVFEITHRGHDVRVLAYDDASGQTIEITAQKVLMCTPQFVNGYLFAHRKNRAQHFHYAPWMLATLTVTELYDNQSMPLSWDNVIYGTQGLGYVYDQHQSLAQLQKRRVITYYRCFEGPDLRKIRRQVYGKTQRDWEQMVFDDLKAAHPDLRTQTEAIDIHILGHGMIGPVPGFISGQARQEAAKPVDGRIFFAHSDLSGISIFEEAFHQGLRAANHMLHGTTLDS